MPINPVPEIKMLPEKKLVGMHKTLSYENYTVTELWQRFMPLRNSIANRIGEEQYSVAVFPLNFHSQFDPKKEFERWATVEVENFENVHEDMETFILPSGMYAVFTYKGDAKNAAEAFQYIFNSYLPQSEFHLDDRPHFEILGSKYRQNHTDSEEEIWVPVGLK
ncbi:MAG TPA: GyrI-like domain-containing protein [Bacteroidia bacterium]|nr:GyrI-like domain-containing protein [Bacteroidia bacterium]